MISSTSKRRVIKVHFETHSHRGHGCPIGITRAPAFIALVSIKEARLLLTLVTHVPDHLACSVTISRPTRLTLLLCPMSLARDSWNRVGYLIHPQRDTERRRGIEFFVRLFTRRGRYESRERLTGDSRFFLP